jgi:hypothetical protein
MPDNLRVLLYDIKGEASLPPDTPIAKFHASAEQINQKIERDIRKLLPPTVTVQATVLFEEGSLVITGIVALLSWAGPIALDVAKEEFGQLIKLCVHRAISQFVGVAVEMSVTPQAVIPRRRSARLFAGGRPGAVIALFVITGVILILQLMMLFDHFFLIHLKP